ncbi:MAG: rhodanese family protein [Alphaproteobacteria bacterium]|nr:rhodanese family protein [Alphaproteobacteria bacterium]
MTHSITYISPAIAQNWLDQKEAVMIDVREPSEFNDEHIKGAILNPLNQFQPDDVKKAAGSRKIIFQCRSGKRASMAIEKFISACPDISPDRIFSLEGSIMGWKEAGMPTLKPQPVSLDRQIFMIAGMVTLVGAGLSAFVSPAFIVIPALTGVGLFLSGATGVCLLKKMLMKLPYNQPKEPANFCAIR